MTNDWRIAANCVDIDPNLFFPTYDGPNIHPIVTQACEECPVSAECLDDALRTPFQAGIRAGIRAIERERMRKRRMAAARRRRT